MNLHLLLLWYLIPDRWPQVEPLAYPFFLTAMATFQAEAVIVTFDGSSLMVATD